MNSAEIREKFIDFFSKNGHITTSASPLVPLNDPSVLFTSAGMQQFKNYYLDPTLAKNKRVTSIQPCIRTSDIDEVGDLTHLTMLEMLGNFSFGDYFKFEAISWGWEFITKILEIDTKRIFVTVYRGDKIVPLDDESIKIWRQIGVKDQNIKMGDREDNFWGPTGEEGPCGPTTEIYVDGIEVWNIVFNQYFKDKKGNFTELSYPGVDTGMGLERIACISQNKKSIYETDLLLPIVNKIKNESKIQNEKSIRIIADHARATTFLLNEGIVPSNKEQGYVLRRLMRRLIVHANLIGFNEPTTQIIPVVIKNFSNIYGQLLDNEEKILEIALSEEEKFSKTIKLGLKRLEKIFASKPKKITGEETFQLYDSFGFPFELTEELAKKENIIVNKCEFDTELLKQKERSRTATKGLFKGGLSGGDEQEKKLHTATHLLHAALRIVLGEHVSQMGSNITPERLRFDFPHNEKLTPSKLTKIENLVNEQIKKALPIIKEETTITEARDSAALGFFKHKYGERVTIYSIGDFSKEICGGPHVKNTKELGHFKIIKEESSSAGVRRIKAILE